MKKLTFIAIAMLALAACNKEEKAAETPAPEATPVVEAPVADTVAAPADSVAAPADSATAPAEEAAAPAEEVK